MTSTKPSAIAHANAARILPSPRGGGLRWERLALLIAWPLGLLSCSAFASDSPGFVIEKPADGIAIPVDGGFLVPYTERIPGSDVTFEMVPVPGGTFTLGSPPNEPDRRDDEGPQVQVTVPPMWVGKHEITWAQYKQYMALNDVFEKFGEQKIRPITDANRVDAVTAPSKLYEPSFTYGAGEEPNQPAVSMSQYAAKQYTKWLSLLTGRFYRIPTEAEWEYAARAGASTAYNFGDDPAATSDHAWHYEISDDLTHAVGERSANAFGLHDMHGNVAEWTLDAYDPNWYATLAARPQPVSAADAVNWPKELYPRVVRGGSWLDDPPALRSAARLATDDEELRGYDPNTPKSPWWFASDAGQGIGFRIVRPWPAPPATERSRYWDADIAEIERVVNHRIDEEGRGERGVVDPDLPAAIEKLQ